MKQIYEFPFLLFLFLTFNTTISFSQNNNQRILIAIEDSLRGRLIWENDSTWMEENLQSQQSILNNKGVYYKLVKIGKQDFTEGPHATFPYQKPKTYNFKFGDSAYSILGEKVYTYIGNSSWGYYYEYQFERVFLLKQLIKIPELKGNIFCKHGFEIQLPNSCLQCDSRLTVINDSVPKINPFGPPKCKHGWDLTRGQHCEGCRLEEQLKNDSTYKIQIREPNTCEHGWDIERGLACSQCLHTYKMNYDSAYRTTYKLDSTIKANSKIYLEDCNHGHICCETSFCDCCPEHLRKKVAKLEETDSTELNKNHSLTVAERHTKEEIKEASVTIAQSKCEHSHDCCRSNCECCPSLTKKERRKLIRKKKRTYRRNIRKYSD